MDLKNASNAELIVRLLTAAAWIDGELHEKERAFLVRVMQRSALAPAQRAVLELAMLEPPQAAAVERVLREVSSRADTEEKREAIFSLVRMLIESDEHKDLEEIAFVERLGDTLRAQGERFFGLLREFFTFQHGKDEPPAAP